MCLADAAKVKVGAVEALVAHAVVDVLAATVAAHAGVLQLNGRARTGGRIIIVRKIGGEERKGVRRGRAVRRRIGQEAGTQREGDQ